VHLLAAEVENREQRTPTWKQQEQQQLLRRLLLMSSDDDVLVKLRSYFGPASSW